VADHTPLIEQIDTWASELEKVQGAPRAVKRVIAEMRQTASDLRADNDADVKDGVCGNCGEEVNFDEHDRDLCRSCRVTCPNCGGSGQVSSETTCVECGGSGRVSHEAAEHLRAVTRHYRKLRAQRKAVRS
jgi:DnaJ-class molecular chaperone